MVLLLHAFDPMALGAVYRLQVGPLHRDLGSWVVPGSDDPESAFFALTLEASDFDVRGAVLVSLQADQKPLVHWWSERGFPATLHALWMGLRRVDSTER